MHRNRFKRVLCVVVASILVLAGTITTNRVFATETEEEYNDKITNLNNKIDELQGKIDGFRQSAADLASQARTLETQIAILQNEQETLRTQIELKQAEFDQLEIDIENTQSRISENSDTIGMTIAQYYYNDKVSTFERLASSENFSSFIDEEVHLVSIADTLAEIVEENKNLKDELEEKKLNAANMILDLGTQKEELAAKEAEQSELLEQTRNSEEAFQLMRLASEAEKTAVEQQKREAQAAWAAAHTQVVGGVSVSAGDPSRGGYPYSGNCPQQQDMFSDAWGMYVCECVSYAAWKVQQNYGYMPYWGHEYANAINWPNLARAYGYSVSSTPKAGTVGIASFWPYGHAVWVEAVSGDSVYVSQYNSSNEATNYSWGEYSEQWFDASTFVYIDFSR